MDMYRIHDMLEEVSEVASTELAKGSDKVDTEEFGEVVDMIKDLTEAEKNKWQSCYYKAVVDAMENADYGSDYDWQGMIDEDRSGYGRSGRMGYNRTRDSRGRYAYGNGNRMGYDQMMEDPRYIEYADGRMGYSNGAYGGGRRNQYSSSGNMGSRYGYSHDEYMEKKHAMKGNDPETMKKRTNMINEHMDDMYEMFKEEVQDLTPEEKQMWKAKLNRIINL